MHDVFTAADEKLDDTFLNAEDLQAWPYRVAGSLGFAFGLTPCFVLKPDGSTIHLFLEALCIHVLVRKVYSNVRITGYSTWNCHTRKAEFG
jgi:hypothetical protein